MYRISIQSDIDSLKISIDEIKQSIEKREVDPLVISYVLYERNKDIFSRFEKESSIPDFVAHLNSIALRYNLVMSWFSYNTWNIQTHIEARNDTRWSRWYEKIVNFIHWYRNDPQSLFHLDEILSFSGHDTITYNASFKVKEFVPDVSKTTPKQEEQNKAENDTWEHNWDIENTWEQEGQENTWEQEDEN